MTQRQAYIKAYPNSKKWKPESVDAEASKLLKVPKVSTRYNELSKEVNEAIKTETIASKQEVLEFMTRLMRREEKEMVVTSRSDKRVWVDEKGDRQEVSTKEPVIVEINTRNTDAFKGAEALAKHYGVLASKDVQDDELSAVDKLLNEIMRGAADDPNN